MCSRYVCIGGSVTYVLQTTSQANDIAAGHVEKYGFQAKISAIRRENNCGCLTLCVVYRYDTELDRFVQL